MITIVLLLAAVVYGQENPVKFTVQQQQTAADEVTITFSGTIAKGWHVYSTNIGEGGPTEATLTTEKAEGAKPLGRLRALGKEQNVTDDIFGMQVRYFEDAVRFVQKYKITRPDYHIAGYLEYGACNDQMCMPPSQVEFDYKSPTPAPSASAKEEQPADNAAATEQSTTALLADGSSPDSTLLQSEVPLSTDSAQADTLISASPFGDAADGAASPTASLWRIFLLGFLGGLIALFTPCVWPIIPMTVSFFLKGQGARSKEQGARGKGVRDAMLYGLSIIVIYVGLGLLITALFGANALNSLATNAVVNVFFCLLLVVFALSFFGWFELTLPSSWANKVDSLSEECRIKNEEYNKIKNEEYRMKNEESGTATNSKKGNSSFFILHSSFIPIFLMALTLTLVSFSCTGPIIGFLLVDFATSGSIAAPAIGMLGFAIALALPFTLFALFPTWLKQAPKSGSWMNTLKVTLGFIELAFACKFFSVADLAYGWHLMDREVFLCLWIVIFGCLGLYLLGLLRFPHDGDRRSMPVPCIVLGMASLAFTVYLIPGLWGAPCKAVSAFSPPMSTQDFNVNPDREVTAQYTDYDEGMAAARRLGKPVMLDFTGYGCVNCRKMEAAVWTDELVAARLKNDYVLISLYVDDKRPLPEPIEVTRPDGTKRHLRTVGDRWSYLEETRYGYLAQPFYVTVDHDGQRLGGTFAYKEDVPAFLQFLDEGLRNFRGL